MKKNRRTAEKKRPGKQPRLYIPTLIASLVVSAFCSLFLGYSMRQNLAERSRMQAENCLTSLEQVFTLCANSTNSMAKVISYQNGYFSYYYQLAKETYEENSLVKNAQIAPHGQVIIVYPEKGNEDFMVNLFSDPSRRADAIRARNSGSVMVAGPFEMEDGSGALAIMEPIYLKPGDLSSFWGFTIVVAETDALLYRAGFSALRNFNFSYYLTARVDGVETYVGGEKEAAGGVLVSHVIGGKNWNLYMKRSMRWYENLLYFGLSVLMVVVSFLLARLRGMNRSLRDRNLTDPLTGIYNRRGFDENLSALISGGRMKRACLVAIDINNFKSFNDLYGHGNGDVLLQTFAQELREFVGGGGEVSRNGGDEFQILLQDPSPEWNARLQTFFDRAHTYNYEGKSYNFNVSGGSVLYPDQERNLQELYRKADLALYHAKTSKKTNFLRFSDDMRTEPREQVGLNFGDLAVGAPSAVLIYKAEGAEEIIYANDECLNLFGCASLSDFMTLSGGSFRSLIYSDDVAWAEQSIEDQQADPANRHMDFLEYRIRRKDGSVRLVTDIGRKIRHEYYGWIYYVILLDAADSGRIRRRER